MKKRILILIVIALLLINTYTIYGDSNYYYTYPDINGHWAEVTIQKWLNYGLVKGFPDGTIRPDSNITKVEFIALINRIYGYHKESSSRYYDVKRSDWYEEDTSIAKENGYMDWYSNKRLYPERSITRQDVSAILYSIMQLDYSSASSKLYKYSDYWSVPSWSKKYISGIVAKGYMSGYPDNTLRVENTITRAEAIVLLDRVMGDYYTRSKTYGSSKSKTYISKNLTIKSSKTRLENMRINGDVLLSAGIKDGDIYLKDVEINGRLIAYGGGKNTVTLNDCDIDEIIVCKENNSIRFSSKDSVIDELNLLSGCRLDGDFDKSTVNIIKRDKDVYLDGDFDNIIIKDRTELDISDDSDIERIEVTDDASGTEIDTSRNTEIYKIIFDAPTRVTGYAKIKKKIINSNKVYIAKKSSHSSGDDTPPYGYSIDISNSYINSSNSTSLSFRVINGELNSRYYYTIDDNSNYTSSISGSGTINSYNQSITGINVSSLRDSTLTLRVYLKDSYSNSGSNVYDYITKDTTPPQSYSLSLSSNTATSDNYSFTVVNGELNSNYIYTIKNTNTNQVISGSGKINSTSQLITANLSGIDSGPLVLSIYLKDSYNNQGSLKSAYFTKQSAGPSGYKLTTVHNTINKDNIKRLSFTINNGIPGSSYSYSLRDSSSGTPDISGTGHINNSTYRVTWIDTTPLVDGELELLVKLINGENISGPIVTLKYQKDTVAPSCDYIQIEDSTISDILSFTIVNGDIGSNYMYTISDSGTNKITGTGFIDSNTKTISNIDVGTLSDGEISLSVILIDAANNISDPYTTTATKNNNPPSGYSVSFLDDYINLANKNNGKIRINDGEIGTKYHFTIDDSNTSTNAITSNGDIDYETQDISDIDLSNLDDGILYLKLYLVDGNGMQGEEVTATIQKDTLPPTCTGISFGQDEINNNNQDNISFTLMGLDNGINCSYSLSDSVDTINGSNTINQPEFTITGIDVSSLKDGIITLDVDLRDDADNAIQLSEQITKNTQTVPTGYGITINQEYINASNKLSFNIIDGTQGANYYYTIDDRNAPDTTPISYSNKLTSDGLKVSNINVSSLHDGMLDISVSLGYTLNDQGPTVTKSIMKDSIAPICVKPQITHHVDDTNKLYMTIGFKNSSTGDKYGYKISDSINTLEDNGILSSIDYTAAPIDMSSLTDGELELTIWMIDEVGNKSNTIKLVLKKSSSGIEVENK